MGLKLKNHIVARLKKRKDIKVMIAEEFGMDSEMGVRTVNRWLKLNKCNGQLTTKAALAIISKYLVEPEKNLTDVNTERTRSPESIGTGQGCKADCQCA